MYRMHKAPVSQPPMAGEYPRASSGRPHLLLDLPIAWRLTLGFLLAALIAAAAAGLTGLQRAQTSSREADFYQVLLAGNTTLTTADSYIQLVNLGVQTTLTDASATPPSTETVSGDETDVANLTTDYTDLMNSYIQSDLLRDHADEVAILGDAGATGDVGLQNTFVASVSRAWEFYLAAQQQVMQDLASGDLTDAAALERVQGQPTNTDANSAVRSLIQFNSQIVSAIKVAIQVEQQNQLITSLIAAIIAFLCIAGVGWIISNTLVTRLNQLRRVTQSVGEGDVGQRVAVAGRDEVAEVSASVNGMLDTIVGLLEVTRRQRDALTNAAERLFTDVRVAGAGDLRINAAVGGDPVGMLANAFNFTIGRFRRFVLRTQASVEQLDVLARQQFERAEAFLGATRNYGQGQGGISDPTGRARQTFASQSILFTGPDSSATTELRLQTQHARELVRRIAREGASYRSQELRDYAEQAYLSAGRVSQLAMSAGVALEQRSVGAIESVLRSQLEELRTLGRLLAQLGAAAYGVQQNSSKELSDLDAAIARLSAVATDVGIMPSGTSAPASTPPGQLGADQSAELSRLSAAFARDVAQMARHVGTLTHELRSGVTPFRVDNASEESSLYAPGTGSGYGEMAPHSRPVFRNQGNGISSPQSYPSSGPRQSRTY